MSSAPAHARRISVAPPAIEPNPAPLHALVVDDELSLRQSLGRILESHGLRVGTVEGGAEAIEYIEADAPDVCVVDILMPNMSGMELLAHVKKRYPLIEVIMMTAYADVDSAVSAMKAGAYHFLTKPFYSTDAVVHAVLKAAEHRRLVDRTKQLEQRLQSLERFGEIIGTSPKMQAVYKLIEGVSTVRSTVLILGESGTGKELVARAIHDRSSRASRPFVAVNCAAIPRELVESELFGHVKGAFTGAQAARAGLFETAHTGTLFLDEVGDLPLSAQVKLLRALQEGEIKRVGADEARMVDVRVLAATNVDLATKIEAGTFRKDLYYRLHVIAISLPPLRERADDIVLLAKYFLQKFARMMERDVRSFSVDALRTLRGYGWPGNVRELEHAVEHAVVLAKRQIIEPDDLPVSAPPGVVRPSLRVPEPRCDAWLSLPANLVDSPYAEAKKRLVATFDEAYTQELLRRSGGNLSAAARQAGLDRSNFRRLLKRGTAPQGGEA